MDKKSSLNELAQKTESVLFGGGKELIDKQHKSGKLTARERITTLLDAGSFVEQDKFVERSLATPGYESVTSAGEGVITGFGTVDGRPVYVFVQDYTVLNGSMSTVHAKKIVKIMDMALQNGAPVIGVIDSGGSRISEGAAAMNAYACILSKMNSLSGVVPTITVLAGQCIGAMAYIAATSDFTFAIDNISMLMLHGAQVVSSTMGVGFSPEDIGSAAAHNERSGVAQFISSNEDEAFAAVRQLLSFIPANNLDDSPYEMTEDDINRQIPEFDTEKHADAMDVILKVADNGQFMEYHATYATDIITGFGRLNGNTVGFIANRSGSPLDAKAAKKAARFLTVLDAYNIPAVTFADCGDIPVEQEASQACLIPAVAKLLYAYAGSSIPMVTVITGSAVAAGLLAMGSKSMGADFVYAWSCAEISALPAETGALIVYSEEIKDSSAPEGAKNVAIEKYKSQYANAFEAARQGVVDDVIAPSATRQMVIAALEACITKRDSRPPKKHGILPL